MYHKYCPRCNNDGTCPMCPLCFRNRKGILPKNYCRNCGNHGRFPFCDKCGRNEKGKLVQEPPEVIEARRLEKLNIRFNEIRELSNEEYEPQLERMYENLVKVNETEITFEEFKENFEKK